MSNQIFLIGTTLLYFSTFEKVTIIFFRNKKPSRHIDKKVSSGIEKLTLGELRRTTSGFQAVLLTLLHPWVTRQEACALQGTAEFRVSLQECAGDPMTDCSSLSGNTATMSDNQYIIFTNSFSQR